MARSKNPDTYPPYLHALLQSAAVAQDPLEIVMDSPEQAKAVRWELYGLRAAYKHTQVLQPYLLGAMLTIRIKVKESTITIGTADKMGKGQSGAIEDALRASGVDLEQFYETLSDGQISREIDNMTHPPLSGASMPSMRNLQPPERSLQPSDMFPKPAPGGLGQGLFQRSEAPLPEPALNPFEAEAQALREKLIQDAKDTTEGAK